MRLHASHDIMHGAYARNMHKYFIIPMHVYLHTPKPDWHTSNMMSQFIDVDLGMLFLVYIFLNFDSVALRSSLLSNVYKGLIGFQQTCPEHYCDIIMVAMASQITSLTIAYLIVHSGAEKRKHQSSASLAFVLGEFTGDQQMASNTGTVSIWWRYHAKSTIFFRGWGVGVAVGGCYSKFFILQCL